MNNNVYKILNRFLKKKIFTSMMIMIDGLKKNKIKFKTNEILFIGWRENILLSGQSQFKNKKKIK